MKKGVLALTVIFFMGSCAVFKKKDKYGCPSDGRNVGAEKLLSGDAKDAGDIKAARKAKYRGGKISY